MYIIKTEKKDKHLQFTYRPFHKNLTELHYSCKLDFGKVLLSWKIYGWIDR